MIKLHGVPLSPFVRKTILALKLKGVEFEEVAQMPYANDAEYRKISPLEKIPALQDGDLTLCDSTAICEYLEDAYPGSALYPQEAKQKARARWFEELGDSKLAELASGIFFQRFMKPMAFKQEPDEALVTDIIENKLPPMLDYLETEIPEDGFLFGDLGVADVSLTTQFINAGYAGYVPDAARWPKFSAYMERVKAHDLVKAQLAVEAQVMAAFG